MEQNIKIISYCMRMRAILPHCFAGNWIPWMTRRFMTLFSPCVCLTTKCHCTGRARVRLDPLPNEETQYQCLSLLSILDVSIHFYPSLSVCVLAVPFLSSHLKCICCSFTDAFCATIPKSSSIHRQETLHTISNE